MVNLLSIDYNHAWVGLSNPPFSHLIIMTSLYFACWGFCLTLKGFVSDDIQGVAQFSDRFVQKKDADGNILKEYEIRDYEVDLKDKDGKFYKVKIKHTGWNPHIEFPGCFLRWAKINWGKKFSKIGENKKGHIIYGWVQDARRHHALNLIFQWFNLLLGYNLITHLFGSNLAFLSMLIFAVHPCGVQTVAWISGINYLFSLFGALATFNMILYVHNTYLLIPIIAFTSAISCLTLLPGCFNWIILLWLGQWNAAIIAGLIGFFVLLRQGKEVISYRFKAFKEQHMEKSTRISFRKIIVMMKTFFYYCHFIPFPKRLGLFHTFMYHWEEPDEHINLEFWLGFIAILAYSFIFWFAPPEVKFGMLWMIVYIATFSNFVTAQQVVSERYAFISTLGFSIVVAYYLQSYPFILTFLLGIAIMRVWVHLPTFQNEVRFYESNCFNFPNSEVAMGNLGVAYLNHGLPNKAFDTWHEGSRQNKQYDVPWYNLYSLCRQNGDLVGARKFLMMCLNAKTNHFPDQWDKEIKELDSFLEKSISVPEFTKRLTDFIKEGHYERAGTI